jgi:HSP20 family molecular chaperone IbpA
MLAAYGSVLPTALAPVVEVPLDFDGPFTMPGEPSYSNYEEKGDASGTLSQRQNLETNSSFISHSNHHHHVNLSDIRNRFHFPTPRGSHARPAHPSQIHSNLHFPHITFRTLPSPAWPHLAWPHIAHSTPTYATTITSWGPRADVRETESAYFVEIEVPGIQNENQLLVQWMTPRTIIVSGDVQRSPLPTASSSDECETSSNGAQGFVKVANLSATTSQNKDAAGDLESLKRTPSVQDNGAARQEVNKDNPASTFLVSERHVGYWRRSFTLPEDVDLDVDPSRNSSGRPLEYKIEAGVMTIRAPKVKK